MPSALIGHTGFVGGNLARQWAFDDCYNSKNIEQIAGKTYDLVVCCGAPAEKWRANREPEKDRQGIARLMNALAQVRAARLVLISTVDVFAGPLGVDESSPADPERATAYGRHRYELETFVQERFDALVVRLPGLFGRGLKKNIIYDFLHHNNVEHIHFQSSFQFYNLEDLGRDLDVALRRELKLVHFATEPVTVADVADAGFGLSFTNAPSAPPARYDMRTRHDALFGGRGGYLADKYAVLTAIRQFVDDAQRKQCA